MDKNTTIQPAKPFVKWAGGKSQLLKDIRAKYPAVLGEQINKYAEPFVGGGAVLFDVLNRHAVSEVFISDINAELIHTYTTIRDKLSELLEILSKLEQEYLSVADEERKKIYYEKREQFNTFKIGEGKSTELAALFIFLNRTCFNGLYRVNAKGNFNVPQGSYKKPCICDTKNLHAVSAKLQNVKIVHGDYRQSADFVDDKTFVYFDPPYRPLSQTANFTSYAQGGFDDTAQRELAKFIDTLSARGAYIVASNSDPRNVDKTDDFFDKLYALYKINRISANRMINCNAENRRAVNELLICN
ncbi:MAG: DNA adenine methylase [Oscillospiraceae bacterium]|nr:DNA adenine methylase [Oscillospiraceae bacterium]